MQNYLYEFNPRRGFQESFLQAAYEEETYLYLFLDFHPNSQEFARVRGNIFPYDLLEHSCCFDLPKDMQI